MKEGHFHMKKQYNVCRMFGTFEWERSDIKIVYGLVDQPQFYNPFKHQVGLIDRFIDI